MRFTALACLIALSIACGTETASPDASVDGGGRDGGAVDAPGRDAPGPDAGVILTVDAGADVSVALPTRVATLHGTATASDGSTPTLRWTSADDVTLAGTSTDTLALSGLVPGTYTLRLTATLASGQSASDDVVVTVTTSGTTYYVATTGDDTTGDGSRAHPWATLAHACGAVHDAGSLIHVIAGDYTETAQCVLAPEVSLEGEGQGAAASGGTHIVLHDMGGGASNAYAGAIQLTSGTPGTEGSQSISDLWLDGNDVVHKGIMVRGRSHVIVRHVTFTRFLTSAACFFGIGAGGVFTVHETGNEFSGSTTTDCSDRGYDGGGVLNMSGQDGIVIRDNVFDQYGRPQGQNGDILASITGHNRGWSFYRNQVHHADYDGVQEGAGGRGWNIAIEIWDNEGGTEIWGNTFRGGGNSIDIGGALDTHVGYDYSWYVHDNLFLLDAAVDAPMGSIVPMAVQFEVAATDGIVSHNHFLRLAHGVQIILGSMAATGQTTERITIDHNYFEAMGLADGSFGGTMVNIGLTRGALVRDIHIDHNTMISARGTVGTMTDVGLSRAALMLDNRNPTGTIGPIDFRNNIVEHVGQYGYITLNGSSAITGVTSSHNILFDNAASNGFYVHHTSSLTPDAPVETGRVESGNLVVDPMLGPDGHPLPGSPAFGAGLDLGSGTTVGAFPE